MTGYLGHTERLRQFSYFWADATLIWQILPVISYNTISQNLAMIMPGSSSGSLKKIPEHADGSS